LNIFERLWAAWYAHLQNDVLATGIMSFVMHEIVYFGRSIPWFIIDHIRYFNKYKIQNVCIKMLLAAATAVFGVSTNLLSAKITDCPRTMELYQARPPIPLHR
jgi:sterol desaturase/sphingolipid hydroxylase (fatty acid hydroxylase superfamily)